MCKPLLRFLKQKAHFAILFIIATSLFFFHSYAVVSRFLKFEILEVHKSLYNESLPLPLVALIIDSQRNFNNGRPFLEMHRFESYLNQHPIANWAITTERYEYANKLQQYFFLNVVNASNYEHAKGIVNWPLRTHFVTGERDNGFKIDAFINTSSFIEERENNSKDKIMLKIISFDTDPNDLTDTQGIPEYFELLPCDDVSIAISLQEYILIDREESPCQNDYPTELKQLVKTPLKPEWLYNAMLTPNLPYDQRVCDNMCMVNYWLPICKCIMSFDIWHYAGGLDNDSLVKCPESFEILETENSCTMLDIYSRTPIEEFAKCKCFKRCQGYAYMVTAYDKNRHRPGIKILITEYTVYA